jgi:hypothetical protein
MPIHIIFMNSDVDDGFHNSSPLNSVLFCRVRYLSCLLQQHHLPQQPSHHHTVATCKFSPAALLTTKEQLTVSLSRTRITVVGYPSPRKESLFEVAEMLPLFRISEFFHTVMVVQGYERSTTIVALAAIQVLSVSSVTLTSDRGSDH